MCFIIHMRDCLDQWHLLFTLQMKRGGKGIFNMDGDCRGPSISPFLLMISYFLWVLNSLKEKMIYRDVGLSYQKKKKKICTFILSSILGTQWVNLHVITLRKKGCHFLKNRVNIQMFNRDLVYLELTVLKLPIAVLRVHPFPLIFYLFFFFVHLIPDIVLGCPLQGIAIAVKCGATKAQFDSTVSWTPLPLLISKLDELITQVVSSSIFRFSRHLWKSAFVLAFFFPGQRILVRLQLITRV